jgi:ABC-type uncharacterized transport system permease subunit
LDRLNSPSLTNGNLAERLDATPLFILCTVIYLGFAALYWPGWGVCCKPSVINRLLPLLPWSLQIYLLWGDVMRGPGIHLGFGNSLSAVAALTVLVHSVAAWRYPLGGLQGFVLVFAGLSVALEALMPEARLVTHSGGAMFRIHLFMAFTAYSLFTIAAMHALLIAVLEKHLHKPVQPRMVAGLPPLLTLERLLFRLIEGGFVLLTLNLASGILFAEQLFGKPLPFNHMTVFGVTSWLIFGGLLVGRKVYGWRGRTAIYWTLVGFVTLVLAYVGVKFVLEVILHRP